MEGFAIIYGRTIVRDVSYLANVSSQRSSLQVINISCDWRFEDESNSIEAYLLQTNSTLKQVKFHTSISVFVTPAWDFSPP